MPQRKQLSVSLVTLLSTTVIALVVWLLLVFLSVTEGIERNWLFKVTALNGPIRIAPTEHYFSSYYYNVDLVSQASQYNFKTLGQKARALVSDPYIPEEDASLPSLFPTPELDKEGKLVDPVKLAYEALQSLNLTFEDYELGGAMMRLRLLRKQGVQEVETHLTQVSYLATLPGKSAALRSLLLAPEEEELVRLKGVQLPYSLEGELHLPEQTERGTGVLLAKNLKENGVQIGDQGFLGYGAATASSVQEQRIPIYVAGFYDPGVLSIGNRCILVPPLVTEAVNASQGSYTLDKKESGGLVVFAPDLNECGAIKSRIEQLFQERGIAPYWKVSTFREYEFTKDLLQQFQSDKMLFTLIGTLILLVACSNIISLLILLVSDKKKEIGILQALGCTKKSIACIFGLCGASVGLIGSLVGVGLACLTLWQIDQIVHFLSFLQGHAAFSTLFFGQSLPKALSFSALCFVLIATPILALLSGLIPAIQAARLSPSETLKQ